MVVVVLTVVLVPVIVVEVKVVVVGGGAQSLRTWLRSEIWNAFFQISMPSVNIQGLRTTGCQLLP